MFAYHVPDLDARAGMDGLRDHPVARRLVGVTRWQTSAHPSGGALVSWVGHPFQPGAYGNPIPTHDGMFFLPPKDWGKDPKAALMRSAMPDHTVVETVNGPLAVGIATRSPRPRRFAGVASVGIPSGALAEAAFSLWDRIAAKEDIAIDDQGLARVLFLGVAACYRVTEEALDGLGWITTADDDKIIQGVFGLDPKAGASVGDTSPSSALASSDPPA